mmetsp:Transcript_26460/g.47672  ORF Transcript_26460/g.47672 Transcript_26460/m.47672 type:complete len:210 (+) Transcript_26460:380-1009(+)
MASRGILAEVSCGIHQVVGGVHPSRACHPPHIGPGSLAGVDPTGPLHCLLAHRRICAARNTSGTGRPALICPVCSPESCRVPTPCSSQTRFTLHCQGESCIEPHCRPLGGSEGRFLASWSPWGIDPSNTFSQHKHSGHVIAEQSRRVSHGVARTFELAYPALGSPLCTKYRQLGKCWQCDVNTGLTLAACASPNMQHFRAISLRHPIFP